MRPSRLSAQLITLNCESNIHFQPSTLMAIGSVNGMTMRPRTSLRALERLHEQEGQRGAEQALQDRRRRSVKTSVLRSAT